MIIPIYTPTSNESLFPFLYILPTIGVVKFLDFYQPDSEIWYLDVVLICIFLYVGVIWTSFHMFMSHLYFFCTYPYEYCVSYFYSDSFYSL